jgi:oxalate---CoA ligase
VDAPDELISRLILGMLNATPPLLIATGYSSIVLVLSMFLQSWTVVVSESPRTRIFPRRWLSIAGAKVQEYWEAALRAVIGVIFFRPGVSQVYARFFL